MIRDEDGRQPKPHLRAADCVEVEERLLDGSPADAAALLAAASDPARLHLDGCDSCRTLAQDLAALATLPPVRAPQATVDAALRAAGAELRAIHGAARSGARRTALRVAATSFLSLPLCAAWALLLWQLGAQWIAPLLPQPLAVALGAGFGFGFLAALSALAFTLTLLAGAVARPPERAPVPVEV